MTDEPRVYYCGWCKEPIGTMGTMGTLDAIHCALFTETRFDGEVGMAARVAYLCPNCQQALMCLLGVDG